MRRTLIHRQAIPRNVQELWIGCVQSWQYCADMEMVAYFVYSQAIRLACRARLIVVHMREEQYLWSRSHCLITWSGNLTFLTIYLCNSSLVVPGKINSLQQCWPIPGKTIHNERASISWINMHCQRTLIPWKEKNNWLYFDHYSKQMSWGHNGCPGVLDLCSLCYFFPSPIDWLMGVFTIDSGLCMKWTMAIDPLILDNSKYGLFVLGNYRYR